MRKLNLLLGLALALLPTPGFSQAAEQAQPEKMNLKNAVSRALEQSPDTRVAREKLNETEAALSQTWSTVFPTIGVIGLANNRKDPLNVGNPAFEGLSYNWYDFHITGTQPLFHAGALSSAVVAARKGKELGNVTLSIAERDLSLRVIQAFYSVLLDEALVRTLEDQKTVQEELLSIARRRVRTGRSRQLEVLQIQSEVSLLEPQILQAKNNLRIAAAQLSNLLGDRNVQQIRVAGTLNAPDWKAIQKEHGESMGQVLELTQNALAQEQLDNQRTVTLAKHFPALDATGTWGRSSYVKSDLLDDSSTSWAFGVQLTVPIFSGLSSIYERRVIASQQAQLRILRDGLENTASLDQVTAKKNVELALAKVDASEVALKLSLEAQSAARREYKLGTIDYTVLTNVELQEVTADTGYQQARYDRLTAEANYYKAYGWPLEEFVERASKVGQ